MTRDRRAVADRTLDELEGVTWGPPKFDSGLVINAHRLRRVPLKDYRVEDLRLMIGQEIGLPYLVPLALDRLEADVFVAGDFYPGDLLTAVARVPDEFWRLRHALARRALQAVDAALARLRDAAPDAYDDDDRTPGATLAGQLAIEWTAARERLAAALAR